MSMSDEADDSVNELMSKAMDLRRIRREQLVVEAAKKSKTMDDKMEKMRSAKKGDKEEKEDKKSDKKDMKKDVKKKASDQTLSKSAGLRNMVDEAFQTKKAESEKDTYKIKLRRAYDVALDMQKKGLLPISKVALDKQVDEIMDFDDRAFEAFKRSVASARPVENVKISKDLGGLNIGVESTEQAPTKSTAELLSLLWE